MKQINNLDKYNILQNEYNNKKDSAKIINKDSVKMINKDKAKIEAAANEFEAYIFSNLYKLSYEKVEVNKMFGGGKAEEIYRSILIDEQVDKYLKDQNILGLKEVIMQDLLKKQQGK